MSNWFAATEKASGACEESVWVALSSSYRHYPQIAIMDIMNINIHDVYGRNILQPFYRISAIFSVALSQPQQCIETFALSAQASILRRYAAIHGVSTQRKPFLRATAGTAIASLSHRNSVCPSVRLSHGWIRQKRCKLGSSNLHHRLPPVSYTHLTLPTILRV